MSSFVYNHLMIGLFSALIVPFRERSWRGTLEGFLSAPVILLILISYLTLGFVLSLVNFTYGARAMEPSVQADLPLFLLLAFLASYLFEILFRGIILRSLLHYLSVRRAIWIHMAILNLLMIPLIHLFVADYYTMGAFRILLAENLLQLFFVLFFLRTGSPLATAFLHGLFNFIRLVIISDVTGPVETLYFFSSASDDLYWLICLCPFVAIGFQVLVIRMCGLRESSYPEKTSRKDWIVPDELEQAEESFW